MRVPLSRPDIGEHEITLVNEVLRSAHLARGPRTTEFEDAVAGYIGRRFGIAVNSGTSGLHLLLRAYGIRAGDEVITTPFSFVASSNVILYERAIPVFVDVEERTGNMDVEQIEAAVTQRTRAILPVDVFGHPARLDEIREIARRHGLVVIEDACEALGSEWRRIPVGHGDWSEAAAFAFYPNKQITTGEGGMIVTDDPDIAALCRSLRNQGRYEPAADGAETNAGTQSQRDAEPDRAVDDELDTLWLRHEQLGYNYRLDELSAALGVAQMGRIEELLSGRERVAALYAERLGGMPGLRLPQVMRGVTRMSWFVFVVRVGAELEEAQAQLLHRNAVMRSLTRDGVQCRPYFTPIHVQPFYRNTFGEQAGKYPIAEELGRTGIAIPFHSRLGTNEVDYVVGALERALAGVPASGQGP